MFQKARQADQRDLKNMLLKPQVGFQVLGGYCCNLAQLTSLVSKGITKLIPSLEETLNVHLWQQLNWFMLLLYIGVKIWIRFDHKEDGAAISFHARLSLNLRTNNTLL